MTNEPATAVLSQAEIDRFHVDGFLLVEDFFSHEELHRFGESVDAAVKRRTSGDNRDLMHKNLYEQTFVQCMGLWEDNPSVRPFTFHPKLCAASAALLQSDCIRLWHDQALYKEAGGRETDAHLDYPFWQTDTPDLVSVWIPLDDVSTGGGMMSYVQGSHTMGITEFVDIGQLRGGDRHNLLRNPQVASLPLVAVAAPKGSAIFHHACTIHAADANETDETRRVFTMAYMADGCRRSSGDAYFALDRDEIKTGELIAGPGFPIAWPRAEDDLPSPPIVPGPKTGFGFSAADDAQ